MPWVAKVSSEQFSERVILDTKVRCLVNWDHWLLSSNSINKTEIAPP